MPYWKTATADSDILMPDPEWTPTYWTPMKTEFSLGDDICDFVENFITPTRMKFDTWKVLPWQRWLLRHLFEVDSFGLWRYKKAYIQIPRKNGKTFLAAAILLWNLVKSVEGDQFYCAASTAKQSRFCYDEVTKNVKNSLALSKLLNPLQNRVSSKINNAFLAPLSFGARGQHGSGPKVVIGDEIHNWGPRGKDQYKALTTGSSDRLEYMFIGITTAGSDMDGIAHELYTYGKAVASGEIEDDEFFFACWEAEEHDDPYDEATWRKANPNMSAGLIDPKDYVQELKEAEIGGIADFLRYFLNQWVHANAGEHFVNPVYMEKALHPTLKEIPLGATIAVGFDGSQVDDSTAFVGIDLNTGLIQILWLKEKKPGQEDFFVEEDEVNDAIQHIMDSYNVVKLYADASRYQGTVKKWMRTWGRQIIRDIPQSPKRMGELSNLFRQRFYGGELFHNDDRRLSAHFMNAVESLKGIPRKQSPKSQAKIDVLIASVLACGAAEEHADFERKRANSVY